MKGIKLTPFLLFVILLVVLVLAMLFGSTSKPVLENMANSGETSSWKQNVGTNAIASYNSGAQLDDIIPIKDGQSGIYYDSSNGNVVITNSLVSSEYTLLTRDSMGVATLVNNASDMANKVSNNAILLDFPNPLKYALE